MKTWREIIDKYYPEGTALRDILLRHSHGVAELASEINSSFKQPLDPLCVETAAMLHDVGIFLTHAPSIECQGERPYICHGFLGADLLRSEGVAEEFAKVCERHTGTGLTPDEIKLNNLPLPAERCYVPESRLEKLICYADKFFSKSGDITSEKPIEKVILSL